MKETEATRQMMKNWQRQRQHLLWYHKIADSRYGMVTGDRAIDVVACCEGRFIGLEFKLVKRGLSIPIKSVRDNQIKTLQAITNAGGLGFLIIIRCFSGTDKHAYAIEPHVWEAFVSVAEKKSIKLSEFDACRFDYVREGRQLNWDMSLIETSIKER